ncbi:MAG: aldehyde dehydrogenase EutE [Candidatus Eisenbacteria bacterium]|uniref:Aldehyde dehydrogenase EutE n=1 Tax=Eiseniibacteriota bacterium TaxID=2212470 RepID=A0A7Y2EAA2_UNCEI|nr:aldehyde dehydrogenase EutE [Candidatus Eisenbacteria bacterium]
MEVSNEKIQAVVKEVLSNFQEPKKPPVGNAAPVSMGSGGIFADVDSAVEAARDAQLALVEGSLDKRYDMVSQMRVAMRHNAELLAWMAREETGLGRYETKIEKNLLCANKTPGPEDLEPLVQTGDHGLTLMELAPFGVVASITPTTNPTATIINNSISIISAGNAVVYNPHPNAKNCSAKTVQLLNQAIVAAGGPANLITCVANPSIESAQQLLRHPLIRLNLVTGGPGVVKEAMKAGKRVIAAGPGNPPAVVDETADLDRAGADIVRGGSFDNQVVCTTEKEVICVDSVADQLKKSMIRAGAFELNPLQIKKLEKVIFKELRAPSKPGVINKDFIGKDAAVILDAIGVKAPADTRMVLVDVPVEHPLVWTEQMMPVMPLARVGNVDQAIALAKKAEHGFRHTAAMHSRNIDALSKMARTMDCSIFVKNGSSLAGLGAGGEGFTSFSIASPTGEGMTRARTFTRWRRCVLVDRFRIV